MSRILESRHRGLVNGGTGRKCENRREIKEKARKGDNRRKQEKAIKGGSKKYHDIDALLRRKNRLKSKT